MNKGEILAIVAAIVSGIFIYSIFANNTKADQWERSCVDFKDILRAELLLVQEQASPAICECCSIIERRSQLCKGALCHETNGCFTNEMKRNYATCMGGGK